MRRRRPLVLRYDVFETVEAKIESIGNSRSILIETVYYDSLLENLVTLSKFLMVCAYIIIKKTIFIENVMEGSDTIATVIEIHTRYSQKHS